jgi:hypothetical protein
MFHMMHEEPIIDSCSQEGSKNVSEVVEHM